MTFARRGIGIRSVLAGLVILGVGGCDLQVDNILEPDRTRALAEATDLEQLVAGAFNSWWVSQGQSAGMINSLSAMAGQHSQWAGNFGMSFLQQIPRPELPNESTHTVYSNLAHNWEWNYRALSSVAIGLLAMDEAGLSPGDMHRLKTFARFQQGISHGTIALLYDQAFVLEETADPLNLELKPYGEVMEAALGFLDEAIQMAGQQSFVIPETWMSRATTTTELAGIASAYKVRFRMGVARDPVERAAVDWDALLADLDRAMDGDFIINTTGLFGAFGGYGNYNGMRCRWSQQQNWVRGMGDQSGAFQEWAATYPVTGRMPFLWVSPDQRFPQGSTLEEQIENPGLYIIVPGSRGMRCSLGDHFNSPALGTWRWSNYRDDRFDAWILAGSVGRLVELSQQELRLARAEALYWKGDLSGAAAIIDETRTTNGGLRPAMDNEDCVPRLPDGSCGDLLETLKWEVRLETYQMGYGKAFWDARGWGDLIEGTMVQVPTPGTELIFLGLPIYTFGGPDAPSAPKGTYGFP